MCVCLYLFVIFFVSRLLAKRKAIQTWNLVHILPYTLSKNAFFCFFEKTTRRAASFEKLPCPVDFPHISSIALFVVSVFRHFQRVVIFACLVAAKIHCMYLLFWIHINTYVYNSKTLSGCSFFSLQHAGIRKKYLVILHSFCAGSYKKWV